MFSIRYREKRGAFMKRFVFFCVMIASLPAVAFSAEDPVAQAMKLFEKRHYGEAAGMLRAQLSSLEQGKEGAAYLTLGMIYLKNAELHRELQQVTAAVSTDYLKKLTSLKGKGRSRFADLYLGEALLEAGKPDQASAPLEQFIASEGIEPRSTAIAKAALGLSYYLRDNKQKAEELWGGVDTADPELKSALAAAYSKAGLVEKNPVILADESLSQAKKSGKGIPTRLLKNVLSVYAKAGLTEKGLALVNSSDLKTFSYREVVSRTKVINFYDLSLLGDMSAIYLQASIAALEKALTDAKLRTTVNYYLGEAYSLSGNVEQSMKTTAAFISSSQMPQQYRDKAMARQGANQYLRGRQFEALGVWDELSRKQPEDPEVLAEVLIACSGIKVDCPKPAKKAAASVESGEGRKISPLNIALGKYYLGKKDYARAASYMEAGRDKSNKNKIESNNPGMLVNLAEAYYRTKKFSEALEIYFEMSKQFPEVRQIQEAMQGIYSMEHKSAGDVKIF
jgi:tetratricopeptide (TPR) repeat protein